MIKYSTPQADAPQAVPNPDLPPPPPSHSADPFRELLSGAKKGPFF